MMERIVSSSVRRTIAPSCASQWPPWRIGSCHAGAALTCAWDTELHRHAVFFRHANNSQDDFLCTEQGPSAGVISQLL